MDYEDELIFDFQKNKVLIVCDYYEYVHIPENFLKKKENITLFPIANIPLIEYILESLYTNKFLDIIIVGENNIKAVVSHIKNTKYFKLMKIKFLKCAVSSLGDILRELGNSQLEFKNLLVMYANSFTNLDLNIILNKHTEFKSKNKNVFATICLFKHQKKKIYNVYGIVDNEMVFFDKSPERDILDIQNVIDKYRTVDFRFFYGIPDYMIISHEVLDYFCENFDLNTMSEFLINIVQNNPYGYKLMVYIPDDEIKKENHDKKSDNEVEIVDQNKMLIEDIQKMTINPTESFGFYKRTLSNLKDYFEMNQEFRLQYSFPYTPDQITKNESQKYLYIGNNYFAKEPENVGNIRSSIIGFNTEIKNVTIESSTISSGCKVKADVENCIVWEGVCVNRNIKECIVISNDEQDIFEISTLDYEESEESYHSEECNSEQEKNEPTFFSQLINYLNDCFLNNSKKNTLSNIRQQINLLTIMWNANDIELVEGIAAFLAQFIRPQDISGSVIEASVIFPLIDCISDNIEEQDYFISIINEHLKIFTYDVRKDALIKYCFLLCEDGYVDRSLIKKYKKLIKHDKLP